MSRILLVHKEQSTVKILTKLLKTEGYKVTSTGNASDAVNMLAAEEFNLVVADADTKSDPDLGVLSSLRSQHPTVPVVIIATNDDDYLARAKALKPFECMPKPMKVDKLLDAVQRAVDYSDESLTENVDLNLQLESVYQFESIVAESPAMKSVCDMVSRVAATDVAVLLAGEAGTGKSAIARAVHENSRRKGKPFVVADCTGEDMDAEEMLFGKEGKAGAVEKASGGTLFLREIASLPVNVQQKLAGALREKSVQRMGKSESIDIDVRLVVTTSRDLARLVQEKSFDSALYDLIKIILIKIPPLRDRRQDIIPTVRSVLRRLVGEDRALPALEQDAVEALEAYDWPENVSEMQRVLKQALDKSEDNKIPKSALPSPLS